MSDTEKAAENKSDVEFIEAPGGSDAFDAMFPASGEPEPNDFGFGDGAEDEPDDGTDETPEPEANKELNDRIAALEAVNQSLQNNMNAQVSERQTALIDGLHKQYQDAIQFGETEKAVDLKIKLDAAYAAKGSAPVAQTPGVPVASDALRKEASDWLAKQHWYGRDAEKTKKLQSITSLLDPSKFTSPAEYINEVDKQVNAPPEAPTVDTGRQSRAPGASTQGTSRPSAKSGDIKSVSELRGAKLQAARTAIRVGNITEKVYIDNYNAVVKAQASRKKAGAR